MSASIGSPYLKPKDSTVTAVVPTVSAPNASSMVSRSARTGSVEVSITRSAAARTGASIRRSAAMPSASVSPARIGWARRLFS